eukprot:scaffold147013_cov32-Tisochrysis_lutea.AAC.1
MQGTSAAHDLRSRRSSSATGEVKTHFGGLVSNLSCSRRQLARKAPHSVRTPPGSSYPGLPR